LCPHGIISFSAFALPIDSYSATSKLSISSIHHIERCPPVSVVSCFIPDLDKAPSSVQSRADDVAGWLLSSFASSEDWAKAGQALIDAEQRAKRAGSAKLTRQVSRVRGEVEDLVLDEGESLSELTELIEKQKHVLRNAQGGDGKSLQVRLLPSRIEM
jgi:hypothetical protein